MNYALQTSEAPLIKKIQNYIFRFADLLGQGNFSKVYKAHNDLTGEVVAIKIVELQSLKSKKLEQLLYSEIDILKKLNHPNVLKCHEVFTSVKNCYIITELCTGGDLQSKLRKQRYFDEASIAPLLRDIFAGLLYLTEKGVVHRDLKVANVFLHDERAKLADFGFAKLTTEKFKDINIGSPIYMSPQGFINNIYGPKTDVWAFGIMIFQLLHGETPFASCKTQSQLKYHLSIPLKRSKIKHSISSQLKDVIVRCVEIDEAKRITMQELALMPYFLRITTPLSPLLAPTHDINCNSLKRFATGRDFMQVHAARSDMRKNRAPSNNTPDDEGKAVRKQSIEKRSYNRLHPVSGGQSQLLRNNPSNNPSNNHSEREVPPQDKWIGRIPQFNVLGSKLLFKECVNVLHYCRLIFKLILTLKMSVYKRQNEIRELTKWLMEVLQEIKERIDREDIIYEGESANLRETKLKEVRDEYEKKYRKELGDYIQSESLSQRHYELDFMISYTYALFQKYDELLYKSRDKVLIAVAYSLVFIYDTTTKLKKCYDAKNYSLFLTYSEIEELLNISKEAINFQFYLKHRAKIYKQN